MKSKRDNIKQLIALLQKKKFHDVLRLGEKVDNKQRSYLFFDIMGTAYVGTGQIKLAISSFYKSIYLNNQFIPSYVNLGKAMTKIKNFKIAEKAFNKALQLNNSETQALIGKGLIKVKQGLLREAAKFYEASLQIKLDRFALRTLAAIYTNLWEDKKDFKDLLRAKELLEKDFSAFPNDAGTTLHQLSGLMARMSFIKFSEKDYSLILAILRQDPTSIIKMENAIKSLIKLHPFFCSSKNFFNSDYEIDQLEETISNLGRIELLIEALSAYPISDLVIERLLVSTRFNVLKNIYKLNNSQYLRRLIFALTKNCFINEHIFSVSVEENYLLEKLQKKLSDDLLKEKFDELKWCIFLCYKHTQDIEFPANIKLSNEFKNIKKIFFDNRKEELLLSKNILSLSEPKSKTSLSVKKQYEENPYPRWFIIDIPKQQSLSSYAHLHNLDFSSVNKERLVSPTILITGCGTGEQSINVATQFINAGVTAIDLSVTSLSYAMRMTNELKINDIEYFQGDLLDMNKLNKKFDFIDCSGVLHHLEDPISGWKSLIKHLHPGGVMRVSLYSKIARKDVLSFRELMKKKDVKYSKNLLLKIREEIIKGQYLGSKNFCAFSDFYTTSELRDLLFHFIEHQFSLIEIKTILQKLCLTFVGLELPAYIKQKFSMKYSSREDFLDLEKWHNFELEFPETFISMYRLWCHKK